MLTSRNLKIFSISLISLFCLQTIADDISYLPKGSTTNIDGFLFPVDKAQEYRKNLIDLDGYKALNESLQKSLDLEKDINKNNELKITTVDNQNDKLAQDLASARSTSDWTKAGCFVLGMVSVVLGALAVSKASK